MADRYQNCRALSAMIVLKDHSEEEVIGLSRAFGRVGFQKILLDIRGADDGQILPLISSITGTKDPKRRIRRVDLLCESDREIGTFEGKIYHTVTENQNFASGDAFFAEAADLSSERLLDDLTGLRLQNPTGEIALSVSDDQADLDELLKTSVSEIVVDASTVAFSLDRFYLKLIQKGFLPKLSPDGVFESEEHHLAETLLSVKEYSLDHASFDTRITATDAMLKALFTIKDETLRRAATRAIKEIHGGARDIRLFNKE